MDEVYVLYVATDLYFVVGTHKNIKKVIRLMLIPCMVIPHLQLPIKHVSHNIS